MQTIKSHVRRLSTQLQHKKLTFVVCFGDETLEFCELEKNFSIDSVFKKCNEKFGVETSEMCLRKDNFVFVPDKSTASVFNKDGQLLVATGDTLRLVELPRVKAQQLRNFLISLDMNDIKRGLFLGNELLAV